VNTTDSPVSSILLTNCLSSNETLSISNLIISVHNVSYFNSMFSTFTCVGLSGSFEINNTWPFFDSSFMSFITSLPMSDGLEKKCRDCVRKHRVKHSSSNTKKIKTVSLPKWNRIFQNKKWELGQISRRVSYSRTRRSQELCWLGIRFSSNLRFWHHDHISYS
jgi:hypothetical protein